MPLWHCPHCGTPQPEAARCWVCQKSSTSCATCRNFRNAVAGQLGYCALDRRRSPLRGTELRGCWEGAAPVPIGIGARTAESLAPVEPALGRTSSARPMTPRPTRAWAEVGPGSDAPAGQVGSERRHEPESPDEDEILVPAAAPLTARREPGPTGLWGDLES